MAGIDKTYLNTYQEYIEVLEWCNKVGTITDEYGNTFNPKDFMNCDLKEADFFSGMVLWNTPTWFDLYLIRNCPVKVIQERLHEQYSDEFIEKVLNHTSEYDKFKRNGLGRNLRASVFKKPTYKCCDNWWWIEIKGDWCYNEYTNEWVHEAECKEWTTNVCTKYRGKLSIRKIMRILRRWNLPKGLTVSIRGTYVGQEWILKTK